MRSAGEWLLRVALLALAGSLLSACSTLPSPPPWPDEAGCHEWLHSLDTAIEAAGVADAEADRIRGWPGLRVDRVGEALRDEARRSSAGFATWSERAAALDDAAREAEIANLPDTAWPIGSEIGRAQVLARTRDCRQRLLRQLSTTPDAQAALLEQATVPSRYSTARRGLGLYPVLRWPFFAGVLAWQNDHQSAMARWAQQPPPLQRFGPDHSSTDLPWPPPRDGLGLPQPDPTLAARMLAHHAPVFEIEVRGDFDRFGKPHWTTTDMPAVDTTEPVVYQRLSHMRWQGRWLLQLTYTLWFPERPARSAFDLLSGALDGVTVRLTLDESGQPMLMDSIHACGCYHLFFPSAALRPTADAPRYQEWLFAPAPLPDLPPTHRLVVRLASATHYLMGVRSEPRDAALQTRYRLRPEEGLRSLPMPAGSATPRRSLFGPDGLVAGTERGERWLFWPMGIASAGAMRQWGHHATAFVGRRHFDDVDLIERRFEPAWP